MLAVKTENIEKRYGRVTALRGISMEIEVGRIYGLVGPDGAGKTSLLRILCGVMRPTAGTARVLGYDTIKEGERLKAKLGYMSQKFALYADLSVRENLDFFADLFQTTPAGLSRKKERLLEFAGLARFQDRLAGRLSGGMKQKLALCCTLIHTPEILILDEPTTGVDPVSRKEFWEMLAPLPGEGTTILVSTAYMDEAARCGRLALLNKGGLLKAGSPDELRRPLVGKIYELSGGDPETVTPVLEKSALIREVRRLGDRIRLESRERLDPEAVAGLLEAIGAGGDSPVALSPAEPSLEDVFVDLTLGGG